MGCPVILKILASYLFYFFRSRSRRKVTFFWAKKSFLLSIPRKFKKIRTPRTLVGNLKRLTKTKGFLEKSNFLTLLGPKNVFFDLKSAEKQFSRFTAP